MAKIDGKKKISFVSDWEEIYIRPPIDQIPDEFLRDTNRNVLVELICHPEDDSDALELKDCLEDIGFDVNLTDKAHCSDENKPNEMWMDKIHKKVNDNDYEGLIMIFAQVAYTNTELKTVWSRFTAQDCPKLKNKPKIFIFQILPRRIRKRSVARDSTATTLNWHAAYETPAEADLLIVHHEYDEDSEADLLDQLSENIKKYGFKEDMTSLITLGSRYSCQPLIISTMTRKFYFMPHPHRGHYHNLVTKQEDSKKYLETIIKHHKPKAIQPGAKSRMSLAKSSATKSVSTKNIDSSRKPDTKSSTATKAAETKFIKPNAKMISKQQPAAAATTDKASTSGLNRQSKFSTTGKQSEPVVVAKKQDKQKKAWTCN